MTDLPVVVTAAGFQPMTPTQVLALLIADVVSTNPGYTANLPGSLIEDVSSTDVAAILECDSFRVELGNSLTPFGANDFLLNQLGQVYGVQIGTASNTSVFVQFSGPAGFVIAVGFTVSDGTYQYTVQDGGVIGSGGTSPLLFCLATIPGSWAVLANTVTTLVTSAPASVSLTVTNPEPGLPGTGAETAESYRSRVLQAGLASAQGMTRFLKTLLAGVQGVQPNLISVQQQVGGGWTVICGGGDPYEVAYAIYTALFDISTLTGSVLGVTAFTAANPGVCTTDLNHGYATGQTVTIAGVDPSAYDGTYSITVVSEKVFSIGVDSSGFGAYVSGGVVTPNLRNITASLLDYPDTYSITFVNPPQQTVTMTITWNTTATNFVSPASVAAAVQPAIVAYVNALPVGQPMNLFVLQDTFQAAVAGIIPIPLQTRMVFAVSINNVLTGPSSGTGVIAGDPESYFFTQASDITVVQG